MSENVSTSFGTDSSAISDSVVAEIKGPDSKVWGDDADRPQSAAAGAVGLELHEIQNEGTPDEIKGPGHEWETDENGEYVNRD